MQTLSEIPNLLKKCLVVIKNMKFVITSCCMKSHIYKRIRFPPEKISAADLI